MPRLLGRSARRRSCTLSEVAMISPAKKKVAGATFWPQLALTRFRHSGSSQLAFDCSQQSLPATNRSSARLWHRLTATAPGVTGFDAAPSLWRPNGRKVLLSSVELADKKSGASPSINVDSLLSVPWKS